MRLSTKLKCRQATVQGGAYVAIGNRTEGRGSCGALAKHGVAPVFSEERVTEDINAYCTAGVVRWDITDIRLCMS